MTPGAGIGWSTRKNSIHPRDKNAHFEGKAPSTRNLLPDVLPCNLARDPDLPPGRRSRGLHRLRQSFSQLGAVKT